MSGIFRTFALAFIKKWLMNKTEDWLDYYADAFDDEEANAQVRRSIEERDRHIEKVRQKEKRKIFWLKVWKIAKGIFSLLVGLATIIGTLHVLGVFT